MTPRALLRSTPVLALSFTLLSCGGITSPKSYSGTIVTVSPQPASVAAGSTTTFTESSGSNPTPPSWLFLNLSGTSTIAGTLTSGSGKSITYTAPATPPIYDAATIATYGTKQGTVELTAAVPETFVTSAYGTIHFVITAPVAVTIAPTTATVVHSATQQFSAYAVGSVNDALTWQVNAVAGGSTANGTISATGLYTAPATLPIVGPTVTVTAVSQADVTKSASAVVTLQ